MNTQSHLNTQKPSPVHAGEVAERIKMRLTKNLAEQGHAFKEKITDDMSFDYIGLDSLARVEMLGELEKEFSIRLDPTAAYDFVTVRALAEFVWSEISGTPLDTKTILGV